MKYDGVCNMPCWVKIKHHFFLKLIYNHHILKQTKLLNMLSVYV